MHLCLCGTRTYVNDRLRGFSSMAGAEKRCADVYASVVVHLEHREEPGLVVPEIQKHATMNKPLRHRRAAAGGQAALGKAGVFRGIYINRHVRNLLHDVTALAV
ncbi:unnamed protein product [Laminaria digitata]